MSQKSNAFVECNNFEWISQTLPNLDNDYNFMEESLKNKNSEPLLKCAKNVTQQIEQRNIYSSKHLNDDVLKNQNHKYI